MSLGAGDVVCRMKKSKPSRARDDAHLSHGRTPYLLAFAAFVCTMMFLGSHYFHFTKSVHVKNANSERRFVADEGSSQNVGGKFPADEPSRKHIQPMQAAETRQEAASDHHPRGVQEGDCNTSYPIPPAWVFRVQGWDKVWEPYCQGAGVCLYSNPSDCRDDSCSSEH